MFVKRVTRGWSNLWSGNIKYGFCGMNAWNSRCG
jgi:hypothetical protein